MSKDSPKIYDMSTGSSFGVDLECLRLLAQSAAYIINTCNTDDTLRSVTTARIINKTVSEMSGVVDTSKIYNKLLLIDIGANDMLSSCTSSWAKEQAQAISRISSKWIDTIEGEGQLSHPPTAKNSPTEKESKLSMSPSKQCDCPSCKRRRERDKELSIQS